MENRFVFRKGLDVPLAGEPRQEIEKGPSIRTVGLVADDYLGMKPTMQVAEGDRVQLGQFLFEDKKTPGVKYTSPGAGVVKSIHRGPKRKFESIVIELEGDGQETFASHGDSNLAQLPRDAVERNLIDSGMWTVLRTRPFSKVPAPGTSPYALLVTAIDTNPHAPDPALVIAEKPADFVAGLEVLSTLTDGATWLCKQVGVPLPGEDLGCVQVAEFGGPHPAGLPGTHMHFLAPVSHERTNWYVNYQDVIAVGHLFLTGELSTDRVVSLSGPVADDPRLVRTRVGASLSDLAAAAGASDVGVRTVSGSVLAGRQRAEMIDHLGRYHLQVTQLAEGTRREFLGWMGPGFKKFSLTPIFAASWLSGAGSRFPLTTSTEGSHRAIVPIGQYERVMPLDLVPTPLLKSIAIGDTDQLQILGGLELDEEDLGLCSFVCASKNDYGPLLRECLTTIESEG